MFFDMSGALCSLLSTYYFIRLNKNAWLIGFIATVINCALYWSKGIYADMGLELIYLLSMGYGWFQWDKTTLHSSPPAQLHQLSAPQWSLLLSLLSCMWIIIYAFLIYYTASSVAFLDATTTSISLLAQWLMCHKIILTWLLWLLVDILYSFMYLTKALPFHCGLMMIYSGLAIVGYVSWRRMSHKK